jgi:hypothetical protein
MEMNIQLLTFPRIYGIRHRDICSLHTISMSLSTKHLYPTDLSCSIHSECDVWIVCGATRVDSRRRQTSYSVHITHHHVIQSSDCGDTRGLIVNETRQFESILYCLGLDLKHHVHLIWLHHSPITFIVASVQTWLLLRPQSNFVGAYLHLHRAENLVPSVISYGSIICFAIFTKATIPSEFGRMWVHEHSLFVNIAYNLRSWSFILK